MANSICSVELWRRGQRTPSNKHHQFGFKAKDTLGNKVEIVENNEIIEVVSKSNTLFGKFNHTLLLNYNTKPMPRLTIYSIYLHWSAVAILAANRLFGGWRGCGLRSTPRQSYQITDSKPLYAEHLYAEPPYAEPLYAESSM